jgi:hypothetical protein
MPHLVIVVISLMLSSMMFLVTAKYTPLQSALEHMTQTRAVEGVRRIELGVINYMKASRDANGYVVLPAAGTDMYAELVPNYLFIPAQPSSGLDWFIQSELYAGIPAVFICITPLRPITAADAKGLVRARRQLGDAAYLGPDCADRTSTAGDHLSFWVVGAHHDYPVDEPTP